VATEPYLSFEGYEFDKAIPIGSQIFKCQTYEYFYHYGKAEVLGRTFVVRGQSIRQPISAPARITACPARFTPPS
jgi:hypothetical protein